MATEEYESASDKLEAMMNGSYEFETDAAEESEEEIVEESEVEEDVAETDPEGDVDNDEDTDQEDDESEDLDDDTETNEQIDGEAQDTDESEETEEDEEPEENALVDADDGTKDPENSSEEDVKDGDPEADAAEADYRAKYEELLQQSEIARNFYEKATSEFVAGGKTVKGFTDPEKVIQSQQMAYGFNDKMSVFKKHKPYYKALQEQGMIDDPAKFDLLMNMAKGDKEAFKQHAKNQGWDLMEMDMDEVKYEGATNLPSQIELALDDVIENASRSGVEDKIKNVLGSEWDSDSVVQLLERPQDSSILVQHMQNGIYDAVQERIGEKNRTDVNGVFSSRSNYDQYMIASRELEAEYQRYTHHESQSMQAQQEAERKQREADEAAKIEDERKKAQYAKTAKQREEEANRARVKATQASRPKNKAKRSVKKVDRMKLTGDDFQNYFNKEILGMS